MGTFWVRSGKAWGLVLDVLRSPERVGHGERREMEEMSPQAQEKSI